MKQLLLVRSFVAIALLASSAFIQPAFAQSIMQDQNTNTWGSGGAASGTAQSFPDIKGTITEQFEVVISGTAPSTTTITVVGAMRGGTTSGTLSSFSSTTSGQMPSFAAGVFDNYKVTTSWTGGDATTKFIINRTGTVARTTVCPGGAADINVGTGANVGAGSNGATKVWGFFLPCSVTTSTLQYAITTADNTANIYDLGVYDNFGNLVLHTGPLAGTALFPSNAQPKSVAWVSSATLSPGRYYFAETCNTCVATLSGTAIGSFNVGGTGPAPSANTLVSGTLPADSWTISVIPTFALR